MVRKTPDKDLGICGVFLSRVHCLAEFGGCSCFVSSRRFEQSRELKDPAEVLERVRMSCWSDCGVRTGSPPGDVGLQAEEVEGEEDTC